MNLENKNILVTGATGGIGASLVHSLVRKGARVMVHGRCRDKLDGLVTSMGDDCARVKIVVADLRDKKGRDDLVAEAVRDGVNVLINNAGIGHFAMFGKTPAQLLEDIIETNVTSTLLLTQSLLPHLMPLPESMIVNVGSTFGTIGFPGYAIYCASKHALKGFSEALRRELADTPVKVLYVAPRATSTNMNSGAAENLNRVLGISSDHPDRVASAILTSMERNTARRQIGWPEKIQVIINDLLPLVVDQFLLKQLPAIKHHSKLIL